MSTVYTTTRLFALLGILFFPLRSVAQTGWTIQAAGINRPDACVADIEAVNDSVVWAIGTVMNYSLGMNSPVQEFTRTTDGGNTWTPGIIDLPPAYTPSCISAIDDQTAWVTAYDIYNGNNGRIYKTVDGGNNWTHQSTAVFNEPAKFIHFFSANEGVAVGDSNVYITSNGGTAWTKAGVIQTPLNMPPYGGLADFLVTAYEVNGDVIWLGDAYGNFYKSDDHGQTWTRLPQSLYPNSIKGIAFKNNLYGIAIGSRFQPGNGGGGGYIDDGIIHLTTDGGQTWNPVNFYFPNNFMSVHLAKFDIAFVTGSQNTFILTAEYGDGYSGISYDGGNSWAIIDSAVQHTACVFTSPTVGWSGGYFSNTSVGIFKWGLPDTTTNIRGLSAAHPSSLLVYPTIASERISLKLKGNDAKRTNGVLQVSDDAGRICMSKELSFEGEEAITISVQNLAVGNYTISVRTKSGTVVSRFIRK